MSTQTVLLNQPNQLLIRISLRHHPFSAHLNSYFLFFPSPFPSLSQPPNTPFRSSCKTHIAISKTAPMVVQDDEGKDCTRLVFTYGTLKRGFSNHTLMQDLMRTGDAVFKGTYRTLEKYPLVCGPYRVPFLLNIPGSGHCVAGELYAVSARGLTRLDELEGTSRGHYERLPIHVVPADDDYEINDGNRLAYVGGATYAEAYYADRGYDMELWKRNGRNGFVVYSEKEAKGYVKRKDRPQNLSFLDHIRIFVSSPSD